MPSPRIVLISGAPGSGKTTLGRHLADALSVPHVNKDRIREGLWLTDPSIARDGDQIWGIWMSSVRLLLTAGVSVVVDQTLYRGRSEADLCSQLLPLGRAVNVHTRSRLADSRWRAKVSDDPMGTRAAASAIRPGGTQYRAVDGSTGPRLPQDRGEDDGWLRSDNQRSGGVDHGPAVIPAGVSV
jgi:hypothetical protein